MGYCFLHVDKIKSNTAMNRKYAHNYRTGDTPNADKSLEHLNEELIELGSVNGQPRTYVDAYNDRFTTLPYYKNHQVRTNATRALEVVTTFSRGENIDINAWKAENKAWLQKTFNVAPDHRDNVVSMVYHGDETGNVHCHTIIIPIDEKGHLNASRFVGNSSLLSSMQTSYAESMKQFGLERGIEGSSAKHEDIRKYYTDLNRAVYDVPDPYEHESAKEYKERVIKELGTARAANLRNIKEAQISARREIDEERTLMRKSVIDDFDAKEKHEVQKLSNIEKQINTAELQYHELSLQLQALEELVDEKKNKVKTFSENVEEYEKMVSTYKQLQAGIQALSIHKPDMLSELNNIFQTMQEYIAESDITIDEPIDIYDLVDEMEQL